MDPLNMRAILQEFSGKRVFITGHTGFKGSWLTYILKEVGADVMGYALPPESAESHFELLGLAKKVRHVIGDLRDGTSLDKALHGFEPEFVFHLAAQALVKRSYQDPVLTFDTNVMGSVRVLDAVRRCESVRSLVHITSDKCYENVEWVWGYRETDRLGGYDPYSASKAAAEVAFSAYARSFFVARPDLGAATTRAGNVIGGGDWAADRIVPDCIRAIRASEPIRLRNPHATRPWQHVLEPLSGYMLLAVLLQRQPAKYGGGSWNFGPTTQTVRTVHDVAKTIVKHLGRGRIEVDDSSAATANHEAALALLQLNCDKAHQLLSWYPRWTVDETLAATAEWYGAVLGGTPAEKITRAQIYRYFPELT